MYRIKYNNSTIFDPYDDDEVVTDAKLTQEVNAAAYLDFTISPKHPLYDTVKERDGVVTLEWLSNDDSEEDEKLFEGIIDAITIDFYGYKAISCVSAMDYLNDTIVRPYSTVAGEQPLTAPSSIEGYFQWLIDQHNSHVLDPKKRFGVGINQGASMRRNDFIYRSSTGNPTTSEEISNQILETLGGYLVMRYENGNNVLDLYSDVHEMNAQIIDFGVNLLDFTKTIDTADQYTALIPQGGSPKFTDGGFEDDDSVWNQYPYLNISTDQKHSGDKSAYFTEGNGEFINSTFFYVREGYRYKSTVWVKNERSSAIKVYPRYQVFVGSVWETRTPDGVNPLEVPNDNEWHEFTFDFLPHASETTKIRPYWVFDSVANDANKRVYVDDFNFVRIQGDQELEEDPITVSQMGDGTTQFSYDIVKYHDVVYSLDAVQRYGYREKVFSDDTITDEDALMQEAIRQLNMVMSPTTGIDIKAIDLAMFMKGYKHLQVGQAVRIRSKFHDTDEYLMVSSVDLDLQDPSQTEYELGKAYDSLTGQQSGYLRSLNSGINSSLDAVASLDQTTKDQAIQIGSVKQVANQAQQTANNAQNTANNAQQTANSNKQSIADLKDQQSEQDKLIEQMQQGIADSEKEIDAINDRIDQMDIDADQIQANIDAVRQEAQTNFETAKNAADAAGQRADAAQEAVDSLRESTSSELQNVKDSVSDVQSDVDAVTQKAADLASELDGTKATVEQVTTDLGEVKTTVSNAATKADQALQVSTSASQTATEAQTTATSAYQDAKSALTQSSVASQTANAVKTELETNYSTTDEIAEQYATKSLVEQTSQSITSTVEATYATKATVEALENIANNAVQTWMGSGVPTLSNKPASDWTTAELKSQHSGDIYYDTDTGYSYRFGSSDGKNYSWSLIKDTDISKAVADAAKAQQTAEGVSDEVTQLKTDIPATYATKTEFKQTTDSIKSSVSEVATTANNALSKATTVEQTANGLQTTVTEQAEKLDNAVTTISQVSQRVDSVSSTITQVSGRVDDVEDKADAAQGTANSALSQASRVEQSLDSFKTSVSRDYQTKTDALSQKSELEQNINSFKTTVSETYTTKDEFNALEIGGTNLLAGTNNGTTGWSGSTKGGKVSITAIHSPSKLVNYPRIEFTDSGSTWRVATYKNASRARTIVANSAGKKFTLSFDAAVTSSNGTNKTIHAFFKEGDSTDNLITFGSFSVPNVEIWNHYELTGTSAGGSITNQVIYFDLTTAMAVDGTAFKVCNLKLEEGNKATPWSPAPEDFDGKYTSKTEFKQTTDKISATATAASQNASSALSKISSLEVSVDGIDTRVEEVASDADEAVKTASQVSQRVDSLSSTITQVSNTANAVLSAGDDLIFDGGFDDVNFWANLPSGASLSDDTTTYSGSRCLKITATPGSSNPSISLTRKFGSNAIANKSTIAGHKYRISFRYNCSSDIEFTEYNFKFRLAKPDGSLIAAYAPGKETGWHYYEAYWTSPQNGSALNVQITWPYVTLTRGYILLDNISMLDVTDVKTATDTANSALSKSSSVEQNLNSFKTNVSQTYETKSDASSKQSSLQQSVNNLRTEVSETYTTKTDVANNYTPKIVAKNTGAGGQTGWFRVAQFKVKSNYSNAAHRVTVANRSSQQTVINIQMASVNNVDPGLGVLTKSGPATVAMAKSAASTWILYVQKSEGYDSLTVTSYEAPNYNPMTVTWLTDQVSAPPSGYKTATNLIGWKNETDYSTKSYVDQTSRTVSLGVVEEYKNGQHGSALATQSDITAAKDSITSTVSQTYLSKTDATNTYLNKNTAASTYATKTEVKQTTDSLTVTISSAMSKAESAATAASNAQNTANNANSTANTAKTNAATAQSTADKANSNAQNAQNRVGNLETCIKMTSDGVRVGKISNGNFTGYSALVNSDGSFDILNASGSMSSRFSDSMIELGKNNSAATISMLNGSGNIVANTNGLDISSPKNVQLTAGGKNSSQTFMVKGDGVYYKNRKIFPPFSVLEKQNYSDITIEAYSYAGFVSVNVRRWNQSGTALFPPAQNRSIIGKINPDYAPKQGIDVLVGIHGNAWLEMSIETNGNISIYELYSDSGVNVASFGGLANYLPKNALM